MTTDAEWAKLPEAWRGRLVWAKLFQNKPIPIAPSELASTWSGMGLVVERMRELEYEYCVQDREDGKHLAEFCKKGSSDYGEATAVADSAPSAAALAAVRAIQEGKR